MAGSWLMYISEYAADPLFFLICYLSIGASLVVMPVLAAHIAYKPVIVLYHPGSGGNVIRQMRSKQHLAINSFYTLVALVGIWLCRKSCG
jgi:hypothetical protein